MGTSNLHLIESVHVMTVFTVVNAELASKKKQSNSPGTPLICISCLLEYMVASLNVSEVPGPRALNPIVAHHCSSLMYMDCGATTLPYRVDLFEIIRLATFTFDR